MKYILFEVNGVPAPVLFPDHVPHSAITIPLSYGIGSAGFRIEQRRVVSAGFVDFNPIRTHGYSESLRVSSRPEDAQIIEAMFGNKAAFDRFRELFTKGRNQGLSELERVEIRSVADEIAKRLDDEEEVSNG